MSFERFWIPHFFNEFGTATSDSCSCGAAFFGVDGFVASIVEDDGCCPAGL